MQSPNENAIHILALAGSFRKGSLNQALIQTARELAPDQVRIDDFDLRTVPFYDGDLEATGDPVEIKTLKSAIAEALLIATPEYNGSIPAVLKNAIGWASRRPTGLSPERQAGGGNGRQSPSQGGTRRAQAHLREVLDRAGVKVISVPSLYLARATEHVSGGRLISDDARQAVREIVVTLNDAVALDIAETFGVAG